MSRQARALASLASDDPSVPDPDPSTRWRALFGSEPPRAAGLIEQAVAWREQVLVHGDVAPAIARDLAIAARHASKRRADMGFEAVSSAASCSVLARPDAAPCSVLPEPNGAPCSVSANSSAAPCSISAEPSTPASRGRAVSPVKRRRATPALLPPASSQLLPGTRLVKSHGGRTHVVEVTGDGFVYAGATFTSLSAVAKHITGTHWNGLLFFGLRRRKTYPARAVSHG